ncbi:MAG TPA: hypothetical protein VF892_15425 [Pseudonocardiaceae bacterium]
MPLRTSSFAATPTGVSAVHVTAGAVSTSWATVPAARRANSACQRDVSMSFPLGPTVGPGVAEPQGRWTV